jgi:hypothetical protein
VGVLAVPEPLRHETRETPHSTFPLGDVRDQRAGQHSTLGAPRHGTAVFWDTLRCRKAAPLTDSLTQRSS